MFNNVQEDLDSKKIDDLNKLYAEIYSQHTDNLNKITVSDVPLEQHELFVHSMTMLMMLSDTVIRFKESCDEIDRIMENILQDFGCEPEKLRNFREKLRNKGH